jgi:hypothetical protein
VERTTIAGETEVLGENLSQCHFVPPQIPHDQVRFRTPDRSGGKPATNRLGYAAAFGRCLVAISDETPTILTFFGFTLSLQASAGMILLFRNCHFLANPSQFIIHL